MRSPPPERLGIGGAPGDFAGSEQLGLLRSLDGGDTWAPRAEGLSGDARERALLGLDVAPQKPTTLFVIAASNRSYWSRGGGVSFQAAPRMAAFAFDPHDADGLHLLGANGNGILESRDGGRTWTPKAPGLSLGPAPRALRSSFAWSPTDPNVVYLSGPYASVFKSEDGGTTWRCVLSADALPR